MTNQVILRDNDSRFIEIILQEIRKIDPKALFNITHFPRTTRIQIQSCAELRGRLFNKLHHLHRLYGLSFTPTQFIKRDKNLITFELKR